MQLLDHVSITVPDLVRAKPFYRAVMAALGVIEAYDRAPGLRDYHPQYYAAFLRDPAGNKIEAVCHHAATSR